MNQAGAPLQELVEEMVDILKQQLEVYSDLTGVSKRKQGVLAAGDVSELDALVDVEQGLLWRAGRLEESRLRVQRLLGPALGVDPEELTISRLAQMAGEPHAGELSGLQESITREMEALTRLNRVNKELIEHSLSYVHFALELICSVECRGEAYAATGNRAGRRPLARVLDQKV